MRATVVAEMPPLCDEGAPDAAEGDARACRKPAAMARSCSSAFRSAAAVASDSSRAAASSRACADRSCSYSANAPAICCRIARRVASDASSCARKPSASAALPEEAPVAAERGAAGGAEGGVCGLPVATWSTSGDDEIASRGERASRDPSDSASGTGEEAGAPPARPPLPEGVPRAGWYGVAAACAGPLPEAKGERGRSSGMERPRTPPESAATSEERTLSTQAAFAASDAHSAATRARSASFPCPCAASISSVRALSRGRVSTWNLSRDFGSPGCGSAFCTPTWTETVAAPSAHTIPAFGRTRYRFGFVVLILKATGRPQARLRSARC
mmetsp:Transcript_17267/g.55565  ORF Transcript_17267/g.55565 Transcript_17267/m.55565 type:complete len:329 (+) Transcript_17267:306-1292(+)